MQKKIIEVWECQCCGRYFEDESACEKHEIACKKRKTVADKWKDINALWMSGGTLEEINDKFGLIKSLPSELRNCTKNSLLKITCPEGCFNGSRRIRIITGKIKEFKSGRLELSHSCKDKIQGIPYSYMKTAIEVNDIIDNHINKIEIISNE